MNHQQLDVMEIAWGLVKVAVKAVARVAVKDVKETVKDSASIHVEIHAKVIVARIAPTHVMAPVVEIVECRAVALVLDHVRTTAQERAELHVP